MKKINTLKFLLLGMPCLLAGAMLGGCGSNDKDNFSFSSYEFSVIADGADSDSLRNVLDDFDGRWTVNLSGILPERLGDKDIAELRDSLMNLANLKEGKRGKLSIALPSEIKELDEDSIKGQSSKGTPRSTLNHELSLMLLTPKLAVFKSYTFTYPEGAPHGGFVNKYLNYDIQNGKILSVKELFTEGYAEWLAPAIYDRLAEQGIDMIVDKEDVNVPANIRLTGDGIEFIYGLYEIAPYSEGEPTVFFTSSELLTILTPEGKAILLNE